MTDEIAIIEAMARAACIDDGKDPDEPIFIKDGVEVRRSMHIPDEFCQVRLTLYLPAARKHYVMAKAMVDASAPSKGDINALKEILRQGTEEMIRKLDAAKPASFKVWGQE